MGLGDASQLDKIVEDVLAATGRHRSCAAASSSNVTRSLVSQGDFDGTAGPDLTHDGLSHNAGI